MYTLTTMIVNDDKRKVRKYLSGFPGSAHDNRVYRSMGLSQTPSEFFSSGGDPTRYFLLGDSVFSNSPTLVLAYKAPANLHTLNTGQETFNTLMARPRITSEHTIGMLKARFPFLRSIPMVITDKPRSVKLILRNIECCIILHNMLIDAEATESEVLPREWYEPGDDPSAIDARSNDDAGDSRGRNDESENNSNMAMELGEVGYSQPFLPQHDSDERRQRCYKYMQEMGLIIT
jgi:hypothetical protein